MESFKDFFDDLKGRLANPLIVSFIISWIVFNWKIAVGLIFYKNNELIFDGYLSYIELITDNAIFWYNYALPFAFSLMYTIGFPFVKARIKLHNATILSKNDSDILKATKEGVMPVDKYIELKQAYEVKVQLLTELTESESGFIQDNAKLTLEHKDLSENLNKSNEKLKQLEQELGFMRALGTPGVLDGVWSLKVFEADGEGYLERIRIDKGIVSFSGQKTLAEIFTYGANQRAKEVVFGIKHLSRDAIDFYSLAIVDHPFQKLKGQINGVVEVEFTKVQDIFNTKPTN